MDRYLPSAAVAEWALQELTDVGTIHVDRKGISSK